MLVRDILMDDDEPLAPLIEITISLDSYEIAHLLEALKMIPKNGDWHNIITRKIQTEMLCLGVNPLEFNYPLNSGMTTTDVKRHIDYIEYKKKFNKE